ncbi:hypothetical protein JCM9279_000396 [Rhodotorula babjevae]
MAHFDGQASELLRKNVDELYEWLGPRVRNSAAEIVGGWLSMSPIDRETVTDVLIATWAEGLCTGHPNVDAVSFENFQRSFDSGFWDGLRGPVRTFLSLSVGFVLIPDLVLQDGHTQQAHPYDVARTSGVYFNYIASKVRMAVVEYARHHDAEYAAAWQSELLGPHGLTVIKLTRLGERATNFIRWRLVHVEEEVRKDPTHSERLDELMWPADKLMRLATVYSQSAEHRFGIYRHLLLSLVRLYTAHNTLNSAPLVRKVDDAQHLDEAIAEWTSPAAFDRFKAHVPEHQAHIVSQARFKILKVCRHLHSKSRLPDVHAVIHNISTVEFDPVEWPDFATTSNESAEPKPHERMRSLAHSAQISDYDARRHYGTTAADWSRGQL